MVRHVRYSGGLGMANHEGAGDGLRATAFDLPRTCPIAEQAGFANFFSTEKVGRRRPTDKFKLKDKFYKYTSPAIGSISNKDVILLQNAIFAPSKTENNTASLFE